MAGPVGGSFFFLSHHLISWVQQLCSPQLVNLAASAMGSFSEAQFENRLLELAMCASVEPVFFSGVGDCCYAPFSWPSDICNVLLFRWHCFSQESDMRATLSSICEGAAFAI